MLVGTGDVSAVLVEEVEVVLRAIEPELLSLNVERLLPNDVLERDEECVGGVIAENPVYEEIDVVFV